MSSSLTMYLGVGRLVRQGDTFMEGQHQVIAEKLASDKDQFAEQYKTSVRQIMDKGAARFSIGKRLRLTSDANNYDLHVLPESVTENGVTHTIIYFAITDTKLGTVHSIPKLFDDLKSGFLGANKTSEICKAKAGGSCNSNSGSVFTALLKRYGDSKIAQVQKKADAVKDVMKDNVAKALDNVEKLDQMELKAEEFENQASQFQKNSNRVFKRMRCQNRKATAMLVGVVVFILLLIIIIASSG